MVPIDRFVVALRCHDFRRKIVRSTAKRPCDIWHVFGEAEIGDLDMAMSIEKQVFGLEIAVDDVLRMQVLQS